VGVGDSAGGATVRNDARKYGREIVATDPQEIAAEEDIAFAFKRAEGRATRGQSRNVKDASSHIDAGGATACIAVKGNEAIRGNAGVTSSASDVRTGEAQITVIFDRGSSRAAATDNRDRS
jgi:hypothetical protein